MLARRLQNLMVSTLFASTIILTVGVGYRQLDWRPRVILIYSIEIVFLGLGDCATAEIISFILEEIYIDVFIALTFDEERLPQRGSLESSGQSRHAIDLFNT